MIELTVTMSPFATGTISDPDHVALLVAEKLLEISALESFARLSQGELEKASRHLGRQGACGRQRRLAQNSTDVLASDLTVDSQRKIRDDVVEMIEITGPVCGRQRGNRAGMQRCGGALARGDVSPETVDQRCDILTPLAQRWQHHRAGGKTCEQCRIEASIRGKIAELLAARADKNHVVLFQLREDEAQAFLFGL